MAKAKISKEVSGMVNLDHPETGEATSYDVQTAQNILDYQVSKGLATNQCWVLNDTNFTLTSDGKIIPRTSNGDH